MISIIIPCKDQANHLSLTLKELNDQISYVGLRVEVIVVDNNSNDKIETVVSRYENVRLVKYINSNSPFAARNEGYKISSHNTLLFLDAKCTPIKGYLEALQKQVNIGDWDILGGEVVPDDIKGLTNIHGLLYALLFLNTKPKYFNGQASAISGNMAVKKSAFQSLGLYNESRSGQDTALVNKARSKGMIIKYAPGMVTTYSSKDRSEFYDFLKHTSKNGLLKMNIFDLRPPNPRLIRNRLIDLNVTLTRSEYIWFYINVWYVRFVRYGYQINVLK